MKNQQGDVEKVISADGTVLAAYTYDAWGNVLTETGSLANANPIRYRGYYYDSETGLYYVSSRYYDPQVCRFINADDSANIGANSDFASTILYAYCGNNPVSRSDDGGEFWHIVAVALVGGLISATVSVISQVLDNKSVDLKTTLYVATSGAIGGALTASGVGVVGQVIGGMINGGVTNYVTQKRKIELGYSKEINKNELIGSIVIGGVCGAISGPGASSTQAGAGGQKQMMNLGVGTVKRTWNALSNNGVKAYIGEAGKAASYYLTSTAKVTSNLFSKSNLFAQIVGSVYSFLS